MTNQSSTTVGARSHATGYARSQRYDPAPEPVGARSRATGVARLDASFCGKSDARSLQLRDKWPCSPRLDVPRRSRGSAPLPPSYPVVRERAPTAVEPFRRSWGARRPSRKTDGFDDD